MKEAMPPLFIPIIDMPLIFFYKKFNEHFFFNPLITENPVVVSGGLGFQDKPYFQQQNGMLNCF